MQHSANIWVPSRNLPIFEYKIHLESASFMIWWRFSWLQNSLAGHRNNALHVTQVTCYWQ